MWNVHESKASRQSGVFLQKQALQFSWKGQNQGLDENKI